MTTPDDCVGVHHWDARGVIKVYADGHVEMDNRDLFFGDLVTEGTPPTAPIGGVQWMPNNRGYLVWLTDGTVHHFDEYSKRES